MGDFYLGSFVRLTSERQILLYGILAILFLSIIFKNIDDNSLMIIPLFLLVLAVPFYVSFKISEKAYKYAIILAVWYEFIFIYLTILYIGRDLLFVINWLDYFYDLLLMLILFLVASWLGKTANKLRE